MSAPAPTPGTQTKGPAQPTSAEAAKLVDSRDAHRKAVIEERSWETVVAPADKLPPKQRTGEFYGREFPQATEEVSDAPEGQAPRSRAYRRARLRHVTEKGATPRSSSARSHAPHWLDAVRYLQAAEPAEAAGLLDEQQQEALAQARAYLEAGTPSASQLRQVAQRERHLNLLMTVGKFRDESQTPEEQAVAETLLRRYLTGELSTDRLRKAEAAVTRALAERRLARKAAEQEVAS